MDIHLLLGLVLGALSLALAPPLVRYAARRATHQPAVVQPEAEERLLEQLMADPSGYVIVAELEPEHFNDEVRAELWRAFQEACSEYEVPKPGSRTRSFRDAAALVDVSAVRAAVLGREGAAGELARELHERSTPPSLKKLLDAGSKVYTAAEDRGEVYGGAVPLSPGGPGELPWVRRYQAPSRGRTLLSAGFLLAVAATAPWLASSSSTAGSLGWYLTTMALVVLAAGGLVWALVDNDTMYLDYRSFFVFGGAAWLLTVVNAGVSGDWSRLLAGVAVFLGTIVVFDGGSRIYAMVRGTDGMGGGDKYIALATAGVPAGLTGNWMLGYYSVFAGLVCFVLFMGVLILRRKATKTTPKAFGPSLALGWFGAYLAMAALGVL